MYDQAPRPRSNLRKPRQPSSLQKAAQRKHITNHRAIMNIVNIFVSFLIPS